MYLQIYVFCLNWSTPRTHEKESYLVTWMHMNTKTNINAFYKYSRGFSMPVPSSCFGCQAHISPILIFLDLAESGRHGVYYRRQLHNNYAMYWIFKALSIHKSVGFKRRYGKYCPFYAVQACNFVTVIFCNRANWTRVGTRITVLI